MALFAALFDSVFNVYISSFTMEQRVGKVPKVGQYLGSDGKIRNAGARTKSKDLGLRTSEKLEKKRLKDNLPSPGY